MKPDKKPFPSLRTDAEAEDFVDNVDLSEYDLSGFRPAEFVLREKSASLSIELPEALIDTIKHQAQAKGMPYSRYVRMLLEEAVTH